MRVAIKDERTPEDLEASRHRARRANRQEQERAALIGGDIAALQAKKTAIDAELDAEIARSAATAQPLAAEFDKLTEEIAGARADGKKVDASKSARRAEISSQLDELQRGRSLAVAAADQRRAALDLEIATLRQGIPNLSILKAELVNRLSTDELRGEAAALEEYVHLTRVWRERSDAKLEECKDHLAKAIESKWESKANDMRGRMNRYECVAKLAGSKYAEAVRLQAENYQKRLAE